MRAFAALLVLAVAGCATRPPVVDDAAANFTINQQLLTPESAGGVGDVQAYRLAPTEGFRMPVAEFAPEPELPQAYRQASLAPTTLCVRVILDAEGRVQRSEPLLAHSQCGAGREAAHAALLQAALEATARWRFRPAGLCHYPAGVAPSADGGCGNAERVEAVAVTLSYAFTFEVEQGKATIRSQGGLR